ncbi:MAG: 30S ribosomal protein S5 [Armatimonadetes bacterium]|nr:30S ribosomal protein S5 [Armatimonadota bacterium]
MPKINADALNLTEQVVRTNKCQKTHKGGQTRSWNALVAVGDYNGHVGVGLGKALAIPDAIRKGVEAAKKNMLKVTIVGSTIPHEVLAHWGSSEVLMKPASEGTGVVAGGSVRPILELAGIKDVLAKSIGSRNAINTAWATMECFKKLKRASDVSQLRGISVEEMVPWMIGMESENGQAPESAGGEGQTAAGVEEVLATDTAAVAVSVEETSAEGEVEPAEGESNA